MTDGSLRAAAARPAARPVRSHMRRRQRSAFLVSGLVAIAVLGLPSTGIGGSIRVYEGAVRGSTGSTVRIEASGRHRPRSAMLSASAVEVGCEDGVARTIDLPREVHLRMRSKRRLVGRRYHVDEGGNRTFAMVRARLFDGYARGRLLLYSDPAGEPEIEHPECVTPGELRWRAEEVKGQ